MTSAPKIQLPPGFEQMSREEQVEYAQRLWEYVSPKPEELPIPPWQLELVKKRADHLESHPEDVLTHEQVLQGINERFGGESGA